MNLLEFIENEIDNMVGPGRQFKTSAEMARYCDVDSSYVHKLMKKGSGKKTLGPFTKVLECLGAQVVFPKSKEEASPTIRHLGKNASAIQADAPESLPIPVYAVAGAGPARELQEADPVFTIVAPPSFATESDFALAIDGESMYPTIKNGAVVGIRQGSKFRQNEIFAVDVPYEGLAVKRVAIDHGNNEYVLRSDNPDKTKYEDIRINIETAPNLLIGRIMWVWQVV